MTGLEELLERLEHLLTEVEQLEEPLRQQVFELLDGVDTLHRIALGRLADQLDGDQLRRLAQGDAAVAWLLEAYDIQPPDPPAPTPVQLRPSPRR